jgi:Mg-chelatase subunit ChlD
VARALLSDRIASVEKLSNELPRLAPEDADLAPYLSQALQYPGDDYVYLIGGEPVLTYWGFRSPHATRSGAAGSGTAGAGPAAGGGPGTGGGQRIRGLWLVLPLLLLAAAVGGWFWFEHEREQALLAALDRALAAECDPIESLKILRERLSEVDPDGSRYPEIHRQAASEAERCAAADRFARDLASASDDCARIAALAPGLEGRDLSRRPFADLSASFQAAQATCDRVQDLLFQLETELGDCRKIKEIRDNIEVLPEDNSPLIAVRRRLDEELAICQQSEKLARELEASSGNCPELLRLDGRMAVLDIGHPALASIRERLDAELDLCDRAERYSRALAEAQTDCAALRKLAGEMQAEDTSTEPLASVRQRLDKALEACQSLDNLDQALQDALGDCGELSALRQRLEADELKRNPMVLNIRRRVVREMDLCALATAWEKRLAAAMGDCAALAGLKPELTGAHAGDPRFDAVRARLVRALARCREAAELEQRLVSAQSDCGRLAALQRELDRPAKGDGAFDALRGRLDSALAKCRPPTIARAKEPAPETKVADKKSPVKRKQTGTVDTRKLCPGERPVELAPDLVIVFDASGSMSQPMSLDPKIAQALQHGGTVGALIGGLARLGSGETRIDVAKKATGSIVNSLPSDVDTGLVLVESCPQARKVGFFSPKQRKQLMSGVYAIRPVRGTPLASGIAKAASMVDGVKAPATIVVISDGQESCNGNPCAVAARIAARKPMLTVNVVDIMGTGAGTCAARATGGRVFTAKNAAQLKTMIRRATAEVRGPSNCRKK